MKIAVLTSGILPIPAVKGGAVENLIDFYLDYNQRHRLHDITVYSVGDPRVFSHPALLAKGESANHYRYIEIWSFWSKVRKHLHKLLHGEQYYHYTIEYYLAEALRDISKKDFDVVILENRVGYALEVSKRTKARIVIHLHNDFLNSETREYQRIYDAASRIITVSEYISDRVKTIDANSRKCITVNNGINLSAFSAERAQGPTRADLGLCPTDFVIAYSGRINKEKGISELIQAMLLLQEQPDIKLLVMGGSFFGDNHTDDPFISRLKAMASELGERIKFTGFLPYDQLPGYLRLADAAIIPSQWEEPFGLTCVEAMAMGKPIIATRRGGIPEILQHDYAILLPTGEAFIRQLAEAILELYHHPERREAMAKAALQASLQFDRDHYAKAFFEALEKRDEQ